MDSIYYHIEQRHDGWHAFPADRDDDTAEGRAFPTKDEALAWCRSIGVIPIPDPVEPGVVIAPEHGGIGRDVTGDA